jgi:hypothetical protein
MLLGKPFARAPKAALHLVKNQQDAMPVAQVAQVFHERSRGDDIPALAEHRLNENRGDIMRRNLADEQFIQRVNRKLAGLFLAHAQFVGIRERRDINTTR